MRLKAFGDVVLGADEFSKACFCDARFDFGRIFVEPADVAFPKPFVSLILRPVIVAAGQLKVPLPGLLGAPARAGRRLLV